MKGFENALEKLIEGFEGFTTELRNMADELPQDRENVVDWPVDAGAGEERDDYEPVQAAQPRDDIDDDKEITMRSGDLRRVIDSYRKLTRFAREGRIPTQDERVKLHQSVRAVKHLIRPPRRAA